MIKKMNKTLFIFIAFLFLSGCKDPFLIDFPYMKDKNHIFEKVDFDDAYSLFSEGSGVIVLAYNSVQYSCPYCMLCLPIINEVGLEEDIKTIYYLDIFDMRSNNTNEYQMLLKLIELQVDDLHEKNGQVALLVPDIYFIDQGKIVAHHLATFYDQEKGSFLLILTDEEREQLKDVYRAGFQKLK